jgi:lipopolysaccharide export system ATP-binding protein
MRRVLLNEDDLTKAPIYQRARAGISYLPQESSVFRRLTVEQNLLAILQTLDLSGAEQKERADGLMKMLGVSHLATHKAFTLSGGERRRVEIARALVLSPFFLLLDEPFTGIDRALSRRFATSAIDPSGIGIRLPIIMLERRGICDGLISSTRVRSRRGHANPSPIAPAENFIWERVLSFNQAV